jgi:alkanesulfonate monooxygenase SsuD/methylene tetrahydromethanopterin reductase-like flavin-dependent oxidoreductase (luciferase family)
LRIGIQLPQGYAHEYAAWEPKRAWQRTCDLARQAEDLGFESIWLVDHLQTLDAADEIIFEALTSLSALAAATSRVRLGPLVLCAAYRNAALTAKMLATLDVISGGRMELGIGAGWKEDEWRAYGYGFPASSERLAILADALEIIVRMLGPGRATFDGRRANVRDAINVPPGLQQPRIPIMVGGNGPNVTWRLAARFADELNLDTFTPGQLRAALPTIRSRCAEIGRDPETLRLSVSLSREQAALNGPARVELLKSYQTLGVSRVMAHLPASAASQEALPDLARDAREAGLTL